MMYMIQGHPSEQSYPICQKIANRQELPAGLPEKRGGGSTAERALERDQAPGTDAVTHEPGHGWRRNWGSRIWGTDAVTHEPGHNYRGYYIKNCQKKQEESQK